MSGETAGEADDRRSRSSARMAERDARRAKVDVWRSVMEVHARVLGELEREFTTRHGLSISDFDTLSNIPTGGVRLRELTDRVVLSQSALSRLVDRLERRGLVERSVPPDDSRAVYVRLTSQGRRLALAAIRTNADVVERVFADRLSEPELRALGTVFGRLRAERPD
ncbi:MarR family winged helix-turn-helix transcriptional regulator [Actinoalloteichus hymeniacidonis]|uniref:Transcriptional regulator n=1 Tax=Actinoalloteichus hymeniacidonis TaxID=340345 RepID=A0AAC9HQ22_9PSEU|nr:MarR family transcriptional regulator [Actinoalloteichus hymeniacidonis]AOS63537.1 transcriptional regulator [Actinoalloteichus hymeniacidonis]MBB5908418.1 DNA-binding MarR family transcriptional regulator [Actinoalloteichus hymeniacidonis]